MKKLKSKRNVKVHRTLGERVKHLRKGSMMKQEDVARLAGCTASCVASIEGGLSVNPTMRTLTGLAAALGVTPQYLSGDNAMKGDVLNSVLQKKFYAKFKALSANDQRRIERMMDDWGKG
jgi:transcriptional regulator with XRE-family HTH domain